MEPLVVHLILVRHGRTEANRTGRIQGHVDTPLDCQGITQAVKLGKLLRGNKFSVAFASDLKRARLTCELILSQAENNVTTPLKITERLRERNYGSAEGKLVSELNKMAAAANSKAPEYVPEGAESLEAMQKRVKEFLKTMFDIISAGDLDSRHLVDNVLIDQKQISEALASIQGAQLEQQEAGTTYPPFLEQDPNAVTCLVVSHGGLIREFLRVVFASAAGNVLAAHEKKRLLICPPNSAFTHLVLIMTSATKYTLNKVLHLHDTSHLK